MSTKLLTDKRTGKTIEFVKATQSMYDADRDAVGLWQIVPNGRDRYGLEGDGLVRFLRLSLLYMFANGAKPVRACNDVDHWILQNQYGDTPEVMTEGIIAEWLAQGAPTPKPYDSLWLALPHIYSPDNKLS